MALLVRDHGFREGLSGVASVSRRDLMGQVDLLESLPPPAPIRLKPHNQLLPAKSPEAKLCEKRVRANRDCPGRCPGMNHLQEWQPCRLTGSQVAESAVGGLPTELRFRGGFGRLHSLEAS